MNILALPPRRVPIDRLPDLAAHVRSLGMLTTDDAARLAAIERARFVLVRIDSIGERWRCRRCNCRHAHFTAFCVELPFRGLERGLYAYWQNVGAADDRDLSPEQRRRRGAVATLLGASGLPSLAGHHPGAARAVATAEGDLDVGAWLIGTIDPIDEAAARTKAALINARAGRTVLRL